MALPRYGIRCLLEQVFNLITTPPNTESTERKPYNQHTKQKIKPWQTDRLSHIQRGFSLDMVWDLGWQKKTTIPWEKGSIFSSISHSLTLHHWEVEHLAVFLAAPKRPVVFNAVSVQKGTRLLLSVYLAPQLHYAYDFGSNFICCSSTGTTCSVGL